jgi:hypothetical protein
MAKIAGNAAWPRRRGDRMKRRQFITLIGSAAAWPQRRAQQPERIRLYKHEWNIVIELGI